MVKFFNHLLLSLFVIILFSVVPVLDLNSESVEAGNTVLDYYIQLPDEYFQCGTVDILREKDKLSLIKKKQLVKGYILAVTTGGKFPLEVALFTDNLMGIKVLAVNVKCTYRKLDFFFVSNGKLIKSDNNFVFPEIEAIEKAAGVSSRYQFKLSEEGKDIKVVDEKSGKVILNIEWSGGIFTIK